MERWDRGFITIDGKEMQVDLDVLSGSIQLQDERSTPDGEYLYKSMTGEEMTIEVISGKWIQVHYASS